MIVKITLTRSQAEDLLAEGIAAAGDISYAQLNRLRDCDHNRRRLIKASIMRRIVALPHSEDA